MTEDRPTEGGLPTPPETPSAEQTTVEPDPVVEADAERHVEEAIEQERAREAPIDEAIWEAQTAGIEAQEASSTGTRVGATDGSRPGLLDRIRALFGGR